MGSLFSFGSLFTSSLIIAKTCEEAIANTYFISVQLIKATVVYSYPPFSSQLPLFSKLYISTGFYEKLISKINYRIFATLIIYTAIIVVFGLFGDYILDYIGSNAAFPEKLFWFTFGISFFIERYVAINLQVQAIVGTVLWHIVNGSQVVLTLIFVYILYSIVGIISIPLSFGLSYMIVLVYVLFITKKLTNNLFALKCFTLLLITLIISSTIIINIDE